MHTMVAKENTPRDTLGHLKSFGLTELWQVALLLPSGWDDMTCPFESFERLPQGKSCVLKGRLASPPSRKFDGTSRLIGKLKDDAGREVGFSVFGDTREFEADLRENPDHVYLFGQIDVFKDAFWLKSPELVQEKWLGRLRPRYPGKPRVINPATVRDRVGRAMRNSIPVAAEHLATHLSSFGDRRELASLAGLPGWSLESIITQAHFPRSLELGQQAQKALEHMAALGILKSARGNQSSKIIDRVLRLGDWRKRAAAIPFTLTDEQEHAITDCLADLASHAPMRRILSADVGAGKSAVYLTVAATVVDGLGTVVVLLPNAALAEQVARDCKEWWSDIPLQLITGDSKEEVCAPLIIGTTAILFRDAVFPSLVVADEQQKFGSIQREQLVGPDTHLLEVTATCIPRSQALIRYGIMKMSKLSKNHTPKTIHTRIWQASEGMELYKAAAGTLEDGDQILLVYPLREKAEVVDEDDRVPRIKPDLRSCKETFVKWSQMFPGKVRWIHGKHSDEEKKAALADMRSNVASILVGTSIVEVGINIPKLRRVIIVHPERFGLTTLHQIRGRVARTGGVGWCDLYLPNKVKAETMTRLQVLVTTTDGFKVAEHDLRLRGGGDMSPGSAKQSGADETFLFGRPVSVDTLDAVMERIRL